MDVTLGCMGYAHTALKSTNLLTGTVLLRTWELEIGFSEL